VLICSRKGWRGFHPFKKTASNPPETETARIGPWI
jgi:hypothetical protein